MKKMMKQKKGQVAWVIALLVANPLVLLGLAIFIILFLLGFWFALGKLLGTFLVLFGGFLTFRMDWKIGLPVMALGLLVFTNPFDWESLQMVGWSA